MAGKITYSVLGSICLVLALLFAGNPDRDTPDLPLTFGLAGIGFMLAAGAFALGEVARSRQMVPTQVPTAHPTAPHPGRAQPYPGQ
jgi:hypothetical protein